MAKKIYCSWCKKEVVKCEHNYELKYKNDGYMTNYSFCKERRSKHFQKYYKENKEEHNEHMRMVVTRTIKGYIQNAWSRFKERGVKYASAKDMIKAETKKIEKAFGGKPFRADGSKHTIHLNIDGNRTSWEVIRRNQA